MAPLKRVCDCLSSHHCTENILSALNLFLLVPLWVDQTGENHLVPGQYYRQGVEAPPIAFPPLFLLLQQVCRCMLLWRRHIFDWSSLSLWLKDWLYLVFRKLQIIRYIGGLLFYQKMDEKDALRVHKNRGHNFICIRFSLCLCPTFFKCLTLVIHLGPWDWTVLWVSSECQQISHFHWL